ncbi:uncharacterized protein LOC143869947 [Tasmannia lanceolata]|uniref:uncharacterized protein LOC143869947 n=1 Tax=Tasmannia lanceolata TaxID=3420 RepID=UPI0040638602
MKRILFSLEGLSFVLAIFFVLHGCNTVKPDCLPPSCGNVRSISYPFRLNSDPQGCGEARYQLYCENCLPSSCGNVRSISYPFRLNSDPQGCGEARYQLYCESNNRTVSSLNSSKYYVGDISYENQVIRIVDSGLQRGDCSSLPRSSLTVFDFEYGDPYVSILGWSMVIKFVERSVLMNNSLYTATTPCFNASSQKYLYVISDEMMKWSDLHTSCKLVQKISIQTLLHGFQKHNYSKIHDLLLMGIELSWKEALSCRECFAKGASSLRYAEYIRNPGRLQIVALRHNPKCDKLCGTSGRCEYSIKNSTHLRCSCFSIQSDQTAVC